MVPFPSNTAAYNKLIYYLKHVVDNRTVEVILLYDVIVFAWDQKRTLLVPVSCISKL